MQLGMNILSQYSVTFKVHKKSTEIKIDGGRIAAARNSASLRGEVKEFSYKSARRMRLVLEDTCDTWEAFSVLTYPKEFPCDGRKVKRDIKAVKQFLVRQGHKDIFWGIEFQRRGAPHINLLLSKEVDKDLLAAAWYRIVGSGDPKHLKAGTGIAKVRKKENIASYIIGYVSKQWQKDVPEEYKNVGRFWGCTRSTLRSSTYTYCFNSFQALNEAISPIVDHYQAKMKEWSSNKEKPYTWQFRGNSFVMWSGSEYINQFIEGGNIDIGKKTFKKRYRVYTRHPQICKRV